MCKVVIVTLGEILKFQDTLGYKGLLHIPVIFFSSLLTVEAHTVRKRGKKLGMLSVHS